MSVAGFAPSAPRLHSHLRVGTGATPVRVAALSRTHRAHSPQHVAPMAAHERQLESERKLDRDCRPLPPASGDGAADVLSEDESSQERGKDRGNASEEEQGAAWLAGGDLPASWLKAVAAAQSAFVNALSETDSTHALSLALAPAGSPDLRAAATAAAMAAAGFSPIPPGAGITALHNEGMDRPGGKKAARRATAPHATATRRRRPRQQEPAVVTVSLAPATSRGGISSPLPHTASQKRARASTQTRCRGWQQRLDGDRVAQQLFPGPTAGRRSRGGAKANRSPPGRRQSIGGEDGARAGPKQGRAAWSPTSRTVPLTNPPARVKGAGAVTPQQASRRGQARARRSGVASRRTVPAAPAPAPRSGEGAVVAWAGSTTVPAVATRQGGRASPKRGGTAPQRTRRSSSTAHERLFRQQTTGSQRREAEVAARRASFARWKQRVASGDVSARSTRPALSPHPDDRLGGNGAVMYPPPAPHVASGPPKGRYGPRHRGAPATAAGRRDPAHSAADAPPPPPPPPPPVPHEGALSRPDSARWQQWQQWQRQWAQWYRDQWQPTQQQHMQSQAAPNAPSTDTAAPGGGGRRRRRLYEPTRPVAAPPGTGPSAGLAEAALGRADDFEAVEQAVATGVGEEAVYEAAVGSDASVLTATCAGSDRHTPQRIDQSPYGPPIPAGTHWGVHSPPQAADLDGASPPPTWLTHPSDAGPSPPPPQHPPRSRGLSAVVERTQWGHTAGLAPLRPTGTRAVPQGSWLQLQLAEALGDGASLQSAGRASAIEPSPTESTTLQPLVSTGRDRWQAAQAEAESHIHTHTRLSEGSVAERGGHQPRSQWSPEAGGEALSPAHLPQVWMQHDRGTFTHNQGDCSPPAEVTTPASGPGLPTRASALDSRGRGAPPRAFSAAEDVGREHVDSSTTTPTQASPASAFAAASRSEAAPPNPTAPPVASVARPRGEGVRTGGQSAPVLYRGEAASPGVASKAPAPAPAPAPAHASRLSHQYQRLRGLLATVRSSEVSPFAPETCGQQQEPPSGAHQQSEQSASRAALCDRGDGGARRRLEVDTGCGEDCSPGEASSTSEDSAAGVQQGAAEPEHDDTTAATGASRRRSLPAVPTLLEPPPEWEVGGGEPTSFSGAGRGGRLVGALPTASEAAPAWDADEAARRRERRLLAWQRVAASGTSAADSPLASRLVAAAPPSTPDSGRRRLSFWGGAPAREDAGQVVQSPSRSDAVAAEEHPASSLSGLIAAARAGTDEGGGSAARRDAPDPSSLPPPRRASDAAAIDRRSVAARQRIRRLSSLMERTSRPGAD